MLGTNREPGNPSLCWWQGVKPRAKVRDRECERGRRGGKAGRRGRGTDGGTLLVWAQVRSCTLPSTAPTWAPIPTVTELPNDFFSFVKNALSRGESAIVLILIAQDQEGDVTDQPSPAKNPAIPQTVIPGSLLLF